MIEDNPYNAEDFILKEEALFHARKHISFLFKRCLNLMEDLKSDHEINFNKLKDGLPTEYGGLLDMANYFDDKRFQHLRKRILDFGGETVRNLDVDIKHL